MGQFLPGCMDRLRKHYSHLVGGSLLAGKAAWTLSRCLTTRVLTVACSLMSVGMVKVTSLLIKAGVDLGSVLESELGQKWKYGVLKACIG